MAEAAVSARVAKAEQLVAQWLAGRATLAEVRGYGADELAAIADVGFAYFAQGKYEQAAIVLEGLAALDPRSAWYRKALGAVALAQGQFEAAVRRYDEAVGISAVDAEAYLGRAEAYLGLGKRKDAEADLQRARKCGQESAFGRRAAAFLKAMKLVNSRR